MRNDRLTLVVGYLFAIMRATQSARSAVKYISPSLVVKLTRQRPYRVRAKNETFLLTVGKPNYAEREMVKLFRTAKEPFPVKRVMMRGWPKRGR